MTTLPQSYAVGPGYVRERYAEPVTVENMYGEQVTTCEIAYNAPIEASQVYVQTLGVGQESGNFSTSSAPVAMQPRLAEATPTPSAWLRVALFCAIAELLTLFALWVINA